MHYRWLHHAGIFRGLDSIHQKFNIGMMLCIPHCSFDDSSYSPWSLRQDYLLEKKDHLCTLPVVSVMSWLVCLAGTLAVKVISEPLDYEWR